LKNNTLEIPPEYEPVRNDIAALSKKVSGNLNIKNRDDKHSVKVNKQVFLSDDFKLLWDRIKYKTTYSVDFDSDELIEKHCIFLKKTHKNIWMRQPGLYQHK